MILRSIAIVATTAILTASLAATAAAKKARKVAQASDSRLQMTVTVSGDQAKKLFQKINSNSAVRILENSTGITIIQLDQVTCTLMGSHGSGPSAARGSESYACDIEL